MSIRRTLALVALAFLPLSCAAKPVARTVNDIARDLCAMFFAEQQGISFEDAARDARATREVLDPFIREILKAKQNAAPRGSAQTESKTETVVTVTTPDGGPAK